MHNTNQPRRATSALIGLAARTALTTGLIAASLNLVASAQMYDNLKPGVMQLEWPTLVVSATEQQLTPTSNAALPPMYMLIMCKSPGIVPKVYLYGDSAAGIAKKPVGREYQDLLAYQIELKRDDESWKIMTADTDPRAPGQTLSTKKILLTGPSLGLIFVDSIAKSFAIQVKWSKPTDASGKTTQEYLAKFNTRFETMKDTQYVDFLKKKCGVLGLK
jgi:hypothetical protein